ncbi:MAG: MBL fold metallo-hydrolase [Phycisphaerae bacterium]|nr:MBL fold metallo-hydrolase [Phycisphaerae bacterium]
MLGISLQSGSNGNCIYIEAGGVQLLFDAGISGKQAALRLEAHGRDISKVDAMFISHDHTDHAKSAGVFQRKFAATMHVSGKTLAASQRHGLGTLECVQHFHTGDTVQVGGAKIETIPTPHDAADPCAFVVEADGKRLGILTDLGYSFDSLGDVIASLDAVFLESNYDPQMLADGPYPGFVKARISSDRGHISNQDSAALLGKFGSHLQWACLAHLSENNNTPQLAMQTHRELLGPAAPIIVAPRHSASQILHVH